MIDLSWYTIPSGVIITLFGFMWIYLFFKSPFYKIKLKKDLIEPKFSILTACRNEENVIYNLISDIKNQTYQNWELLICVNNTTDRTYERAIESAGRDPRIKIFNHNPEEIGKSPALNYILNKATGDVVVEFDTDNRIKKDYLEKLSKYFMDSNIKAVQTVIKAANGKKNFLTRMQDIEFIVYSRIFNKGRYHEGSSIGGTGFAIRLAILKRLGGWENNLTEDYELFNRLQKNKIRVTYADNIIVYDEKPESFSDLIKQRKRWIRGHMSVTKKYFGRTNNILDAAYLISPLIVAMIIFNLFLYYFMLFGGNNFVRYNYIPIYFWGISLFLYLIILFSVLWNEDKSHIPYILPYIFIFNFHWIIVFFESFSVKSWADTKTIHRGI